MKRSAQIVLVVMAATGVGATSYALMPREDCSQQPGAAQSDACRRSYGSGGHGGSGYGFWSHGSSGSSWGSSSGSPSTSSALSGGVARGGFGGTGHAMGGGHAGT